MFFIIGIFVVLFCVATGYVLHGGDLAILWQPTEFLIILGAGVGSIIIGYPPAAIKRSFIALGHFFKAKPYTKQDYMELLLFSLNAFKIMKVKGMLAIEPHIETVDESELFQLGPSIRKEQFILDFIVDNLRLMTMGMDNAMQFEDLMNAEIDLYKVNASAGADIYSDLGQSLPALGIVAAVLGVINTMKSVLEPPDVLGGLIAAALVGTFFGIFMAYGFFAPMGHFLEKYASYRVKFLECMKIGFIAYLNGNAPVIVVEFMRKNIPEDYRPSFDDLDVYLNENSLKAG